MGSAAVQSALQAQGYNWGLSLESANAALPSGRRNVPHQCRKQWSSFCLDGTGLNASGVKAIIAVGVILVVAAITALMVWLDIRRRSGAVRPTCWPLVPALWGAHAASGAWPGQQLRACGRPALRCPAALQRTQLLARRLRRSPLG